MENEHQLGTKPKEIDVLIIKKEKAEPIEKNIGRIFRRHNIVEYKAPGDSFSVDDFYKVLAYTLFYKTDTVKENEIDISDITVTMVSHSHPRKMLKHLKEVRKYRIEKVEKGIYYVTGGMFPMQVIVTRKLTDEKNFWLHNLTNQVKREETAEKIMEEYSKHRNEKMYRSVMEVIVRANREKFEEVSGDMCDALREIFDEDLKRIAKEMAKEMAVEMAEEMAVEMAVEMAEERAEKIAEEKVEKKVREELQEREIAVMEKGRESNLKESIRNLMDSMKWTLEQAMNALKVPEQEQPKYAAMLKKGF